MAYLSMLDAQFGTPKLLLSKAPSLFRGKKILRLVESCLGRRIGGGWYNERMIWVVVLRRFFRRWGGGVDGVPFAFWMDICLFFSWKGAFSGGGGGF